MKRSTVALLGAAALAACGDLGVGKGRGALGVSPVLDSLFVGDRLPPLSDTYIDPNGNPAPPGRVNWASSDDSVARIDSLGRMTGRTRGLAIITRQGQGPTGGAQVVASPTPDLTL